MKRIFLFLLVLNISVFATNNISFDHYFLDKTMRIDYFHTGNSNKEIVAIDKIYSYNKWAGNPATLLNPFKVGLFKIKVYDLKSNKLLFSKGFNSYFGEYQTTTEAINGIFQTYHETALIPFPKNSVKFVLERMDKKHNLIKIFESVINPKKITIAKPKKYKNISVVKSHISGNPHKKVDIVIVAEGYTKSQLGKFKKDLNHYTNLFLNQPPYSNTKDSFNISGVFIPSEESGTTEPTHGKFKNTAIGTTFNSLGSYRYLLTKDNKALRDVAGSTPYDAIFVMVNSTRYGGAGIYNFFCTFTTDNVWSDYVFLHEFGHSFSGLADEYYSSSTSYNDFYPKGVEPFEANITRLLNGKDNIKWKNLLTQDIEIPTPWDKKLFDKKDEDYQKIRKQINEKIAILSTKNNNPEELNKLKQLAVKLSKENKVWGDNFFKNSKYADKVGVFEGAGYSSTGIYRPALDCIMFSKGAKPFCPVCEAHIKKIINSYCQ